MYLCVVADLLLIQCMHAVVCSTFRVRVMVRFCFSVGIVVSGGGRVGRRVTI